MKCCFKIHHSKKYTFTQTLICFNDISVELQSNTHDVSICKSSNRGHGADIFVIVYSPDKIRKFCRITNQLRDFK